MRNKLIKDILINTVEPSCVTSYKKSHLYKNKNTILLPSQPKANVLELMVRYRSKYIMNVFCDEMWRGRA